MEIVEFNVNGRYTMLDLDEHWREVFAEYDKFLPSDVAARVATAVCEAISRAYAQCPSGDGCPECARAHDDLGDWFTGK